MTRSLSRALRFASSSIAAAVLACAGMPAGAQNGVGDVPYDFSQSIFKPVHAQHGMVVTENRLATQAGVDVLRAGGNAVDAAVAIGFMLAVTLPNAGNIGGGGFMVLHDAKSGKDVAIDFRETAPSAATPTMYLDAAGNVVPHRSTFTHFAVGVPGTVAGLLHALDRFGTRPRAELIAPAIRVAERGYPVSEELAEALAYDRRNLQPWEATRQVFFKDGHPLQAGDLLRQPDLANSLRLIARQGAPAFYDGPIGRAIVAEMKRHDGLITLADLKNYKAVEREPVRGTYRGYDIVSMPPPSSGGAHIVEILNILEHWPLKDYGPDSAHTIQLMAEAMKLAYADRSKYLGDPDFIKIPLKGLTSKAYSDELAKKIDPDHATPSASIRPGQPQPYESDQTTHYSVADAAGNVASVTYTLNLYFGSGIVAEGTGILLNDEMDDFSSKPGVPNAFGLIGGDANAVQGGKRPLSSMSPTLVLKDGKPWAVTGSPGGSRIINITLETLVDMIDFGLNPAEAAAMPRVHHQWMPDELRVEHGLSRDTVDLLKAKGQHVVEGPSMGRTQTIRISPAGFYGGSDPRDPDGLAEGY